jgi:uncharacterized protein
LSATLSKSTDAGPVGRSERVGSIDVLRGFAVLGILVMNIQSFSMIGAAYNNPHAYGDLGGINSMVWLLSHLLADRKFMAIFSMLFGAGVVLMSERAEATGRSAAGIHYRRMLWLIIFGFVHARILWYGDILFAYGVCGLLIFLFRRVRPRRLIIVGLLAIALPSLLNFVWQVTLPYWPSEAVEQLEREWWLPTSDVVESEVEAYRGGWAEQQPHRSEGADFMQIQFLFMENLWRAGGLMLLGMALFKLGVFSAQRSRVSYIRCVSLGFGIGLPIAFFGVLYRQDSGWDIRTAFFGGGQFNYWASLLVALGWVGVVMLACLQPRLDRWTGQLAAVGRMALSCYLGQTIICTTVFYGHGLGLYGSVERWGQVVIVVAVWVLMLVVCPIWLRHFRFGPFEWMWRSLTYMKLQPIKAEVAENQGFG